MTIKIKNKMREIKFRVWEIKEERMLSNGSFDIHLYRDGDYGISHHFLNERTREYAFTTCKRNDFDNTKPEVILMQFTSFKDKNRKDIYEGDIVKALFNNQYLEIVFHRGCFHLKDQNTILTSLGDYLVSRKVEVMGNIYEHSHLLEGEKNDN